MPKVVFTILFLAMVMGTYAQKEGQQLVDSLSTELDFSKEDTNKVRLLATLSYEMSNINTEEGLKRGEDVHEGMRVWHIFRISHLTFDKSTLNLEPQPLNLALLKFQMVNCELKT